MSYSSYRLNDDYCSQWYICNFEYDDTTYTSLEQWMLASKAACIRDHVSLQRIMNANNINSLINAGKYIKNANDSKWNRIRYQMAVHGNYLKFSQNSYLCNWLLNTGNCNLIEQSTTDRLWGSRNENILGNSIIDVRNQLRNE
jgi:ribA/ribD-fused uncharacterized protein